MNATSLEELRGRIEPARGEDQKMDQVRELLFGEQQRLMEGRVAVLETRIRELELSFHRRLDALQARLDALAGEVTAERRTGYEEIGRALKDIGERVNRLASE